MRRKYRWNAELKSLVEVPVDSRPALVAPFIHPDLPPYESPIDGRIVDGRRARREDLKRSGCRPWEGISEERKEAAKVQAVKERQLDLLAEKMAHRAWAEAPERVRRVFRSK